MNVPSPNAIRQSSLILGGSHYAMPTICGFIRASLVPLQLSSVCGPNFLEFLLKTIYYFSYCVNSLFGSPAILENGLEFRYVTGKKNRT
jgi:hypothetical protein